MVRRRRAGVLLHLSSLPGRLGIGDLGPAAYTFVDQLTRARQSVWQILPFGPTGYGDSPYQCYSAFAGNPLFVSPERLIEDGLLPADDTHESHRFPQGGIDFEGLIPIRTAWLRQAFETFENLRSRPQHSAFEAFCEAESKWLDDYSLFMALRDQWPNGCWTDWPEPLRTRQRKALAQARKDFDSDIRFHQFVQYQFARQWADLQAYAHKRHLKIMGDLPIFVSHESADVWAHQDQFQLDGNGRPLKVAGVPPDYFSETGQLWGNPLYEWDRMEADGFAWWIERVRTSLKSLDLIRLDHFRGFEAYWEIPADAPTAATGRWVAGPRERLFDRLKSVLGPLPIIAEDLGVITKEVEELRDSCGFPGMRVLQFAFAPAEAVHRPHNYVPNSVAYTGTHDNDTTVGWFRSAPGDSTTLTASEVHDERRFALRYLNTDGHDINWTMLRAVWASVSDLAIVPVQDLLGLGSEARMNLPGTSSGNWRWRLAADELTTGLLDRLAALTELYDRDVDHLLEQPPVIRVVNPDENGRDEAKK